MKDFLVDAIGVWGYSLVSPEAVNSGDVPVTYAFTYNLLPKCIDTFVLL